MAQLDFYLSEKDKLDLMSFVFREGGYIIPSIHYDRAEYKIVSSVEEYRDFVDRSILFFIAHDSYFKEPLVWEKFEKGDRELFYIPQRIGGPTIDFYSPGIINEEGTRFIGQGNVSYYTSYQSFIRRSNLEAPEAQKTFYKKICNELKKGFAIKLSRRTYWVGNGALEDLRSGWKLMNVSDEVLNQFLAFAQV